MDIIWKRIEGFDYEVSSCGQVKSITRQIERFNGRITHNKTVNERILKSAVSGYGTGYEFVSLCKNGKAYNKRVHHAVAEAFIGKRENGMIIHHKDGNKLNNNVSNLEYTSRQKNTMYYYNSLGMSLGKIPYNDIPSIIESINKGAKCIDVAKKYGVMRTDISVLCKIINLTGEELVLSAGSEVK
jgi:hypothetical protein